MKNIFFFCLIAVVVLASVSLVFAKKEPCLPDGPADFDAAPVNATGVAFSWTSLLDADKYSIDVMIDDGAIITEQSFSTTDTSLAVDFTEFIACGDATAKVKGLNPPGKGVCSQNNGWSDESSFVIPCPSPLP